MDFLSAPSNFLAQRFRNVDSLILGPTILSVKIDRKYPSWADTGAALYFNVEAIIIIMIIVIIISIIVVIIICIFVIVIVIIISVTIIIYTISIIVIKNVV